MFCGYIDPGTGTTLSSLGGWAFSLFLGFLSLLIVFFKKGLSFFRRHKRLSFGIMSGLLILALITLGAAMTRKKSSLDKKIVILGFDGLSPDILEPMMAEGALPNFQRLKEKGSYQRLATTNPPQSPVAWAAFATGKNPGENGIFDFIIRDPGTYTLSLALSRIKNNKPKRVLKARAFWQETSKAGVPTVIIGCPLTFPPDKIRGRMLSGMGVPDILGTEGTFTFYTSEPPGQSKDTGGKVFSVKRSPVMKLNLIGPKIASWGAKTMNSQVPLKASLENNPKGVVLEWQGHLCRLEAGQRSDWQEVAFEVTPFRKLKGIFKFILVEAAPAFKLYISPIQLDPRDPAYPISAPAGYSKELAAKLGLFHTAGMPVDTWAVNEKRLSGKELLQQADEVLSERKKALDLELGRLKTGVLFCYFGTADTVQHMFWDQEGQATIKAWYKKLDGVLGDVMEKIKGTDTLIVLSDHGFGPFHRTAHVNTWLRENGYLALKNPSAPEGKELLQDVDWSKTKAYAISFGGIYINQKGREGNGIIAPGPETQHLKEEIAGKCGNWIDKKDGGRVVHRVYKNEDIFKGPYAKDAPDLFIGFNKGFRASWQTALGACPRETLEDNSKKWSGDHLIDPTLVPGVLLTNKPGTPENISIAGIAQKIIADTRGT